MTDAQFKILMESSEVFKAFPKFKQNIYLNLKVQQRLQDYYGQAQRHGMDYIRQNPHLTISDIKLIESIL